MLYGRCLHARWYVLACALCISGWHAECIERACEHLVGLHQGRLACVPRVCHAQPCTVYIYSSAGCTESPCIDTLLLIAILAGMPRELDAQANSPASVLQLSLHFCQGMQY